MTLHPARFPMRCIGQRAPPYGTEDPAIVSQSSGVIVARASPHESDRRGLTRWPASFHEFREFAKEIVSTVMPEA